LTDFQKIYDSFFSKVDSDYEGREGNVFEFMKSAKTRVENNVPISLEYFVTDPVLFEGYFVETLEDKVIEIIALWMVWYECAKERQRIVRKREEIGTKDFNRNERNKELMDSKTKALELAYFDAVRYQQDFFYV
jgi:hypothetical protein